MKYVLDKLEREAGSLGKESWRPLLAYVAALHGRAIHPPRTPLRLPWEEIGPGYSFGPAFGHWDIVHATLDSLPTEAEHAKNQLRNVLDIQQPDGLLPGSVWMKADAPTWNLKGYPPVWPYAVEEICKAEGDCSFSVECFEPLRRSIAWYERNRKCDDGGFHYTFDSAWESGVDDGLRFADALPERNAAVDACSHVYWLYKYAELWAGRLALKSQAEYAEKAEALQRLIQTKLFDKETGFFHDIWSAGRPELRRMSFEGIWPVVVGAASKEQAARAIDENILNPKRFFAKHPISTVALSDPGFEPRMWRGPAWNSMTLWTAIGCMRYGRCAAAEALLERALDASAVQFERTGTIWEFYDSLGGEPEKLRRKPSRDMPCRDYLGHNPLIAMARLWRDAKAQKERKAANSRFEKRELSLELLSNPSQA